jgi:hypothetical protein
MEFCCCRRGVSTVSHGVSIPASLGCVSQGSSTLDWHHILLQGCGHALLYATPPWCQCASCAHVWTTGPALPEIFNALCDIQCYTKLEALNSCGLRVIRSASLEAPTAHPETAPLFGWEVRHHIPPSNIKSCTQRVTATGSSSTDCDGRGAVLHLHGAFAQIAQGDALILI